MSADKRWLVKSRLEGSEGGERAQLVPRAGQEVGPAEQEPQPLWRGADSLVEVEHGIGRELGIG